jgi:hypothetical protein
MLFALSLPFYSLSLSASYFPRRDTPSRCAVCSATKSAALSYFPTLPHTEHRIYDTAIKTS